VKAVFAMESRYDPQNEVLYLIRTDELPESPRTDFNLWSFVLFHKRYDLENSLKLKYQDFEGWEELEGYIKDRYPDCEIEPVYMYEHGLVHLSRGRTCAWDSGRLGVAYRHPSDEPMTPEAALKALDEELEEYTNYLNGDALELVVTRKDDDPEYSTFYTVESLKAYLESNEPGYATAKPLTRVPQNEGYKSKAAAFIEDKGLMPEYLKWLTE